VASPVGYERTSHSRLVPETRSEPQERDHRTSITRILSVLSASCEISGTRLRMESLYWHGFRTRVRLPPPPPI